jgi:hypothetical protein
MREQAIQFVSEPGAGGIAATVDAAEAERLLALLGGTGRIEIGLAAEDEDDVEGHLFGAGAIVRLIVRRPDGDDVEGHTLTLRFPTAAEAAKFKTKVLAGGLLVGTLIAPAAGLAGTQANTASLGDAGGVAPAAHTQIQTAPVQSNTLQIVLPSGGSGENNQMGSAVAWMTRTDTSR